MLLLVLLATFPALPASAAKGDVELIFDAPPELEPIVRRLRQMPAGSYEGGLDVTGLRDPGGPIRVILAAEGSPLAERAPAWVNGYALGNIGVVVLLAERVPSYPNGSLEEVLRHEVAHVLIDRAAGVTGENAPRRVPRWLHEGTAMLAAGQWGLRGQGYVTLARLRIRNLSLARIDEYFAGSPDDVTRAYALSGAFVHYVEQQYGGRRGGAIAAILSRLEQGRPFPGAFRDVTGVSLAYAELEFWGGESFLSRWLPLIANEGFLWAGISLLALLAIYLRRRRDARMRERWLKEEELERLQLEAEKLRREGELDGLRLVGEVSASEELASEGEGAGAGDSESEEWVN